MSRLGWLGLVAGPHDPPPAARELKGHARPTVLLCTPCVRAVYVRCTGFTAKTPAIPGFLPPRSRPVIPRNARCRCA
ncbi:hypothetical protein DPM13_15955 [Paracoccus mutanolyticus]|uniref:Uncharacterized protein n=1 Tax=Paracoccus mutanolyticus TaxID=1499308 RepID=A0ABM6WTA4_9RHOB|nr:hypothetical protein DPM13_15955 [Paracoccus mutanolyticus]